ncbi:translation initiation factor IF-2 subunit gamma [archaeon]|nr:translation initiation factor IF-2 subunit gamma [archaeon]
MPKKKLKQPEINIGLVGHVDHGKTTLVSRLSGKWTDTHSEEVKKGITIRLGYANATFYSCSKCKKLTSLNQCPECKAKCEEIRTISFVDAPGHETLMATMLSGSAIMDAALLLVAADEKCPQPQTKEHLMALEIGGIKNIIIVQNKIDLVSEEDAMKNYNSIKEFVKGSIAENAPIVPISAQHNVNIDLLIKTIEETFKTPKRDPKKNPKMFLARSFDVNKPGVIIQKLIGGVLGGSLMEGQIKVGDKIEIKPGMKVEKEGKTNWIPIETEIIGIKSGNDNLKEAIPGGSIALLTNLDPAYVKSDKLSGNIVGLPGKLPETHITLELTPHLLERVVGSEKELKVDPIKKGEVLMLTVNATATAGIVSELSKNAFKITLKLPVCADKNDKFTISRRVGHRFRLIGYGSLK